ncbi:MULTISPECIES: hypothetical protein [unclassified Arcicella]|uniref:hypothetical protein n=1 Tax=unclassified Arcicella TaxID=2644986 RepID=UPI002866DD10|nr:MULTISPECIES: hypothetical protein [unclassified Arcicella]MDR6562794.1 hypothetical protein [Arcicella sp. BE51]MDR6812862.1 hypothetical protein [Arcicella sp. BE140]MDR6824176.1 hypothetical protein [Arcicella sp. BE139]
MKKATILVFIISLFTIKAVSQTVTLPPNNTIDSTKLGLNFKNAPFYARFMPLSIYTGAGKTRDRVAQFIEFGKSFNVIDLGIALGRNSLRPDTTTFLEGKITMDVCNYGIFANEMTIGAGKVFDAEGSLMLELSYSIFAQLSKNWGIGISTGYYDFSNEFYDSAKTYYGFFIRYGLQRTDTGGLLGIGRGHGRPGRAGHRGHGR